MTNILFQNALVRQKQNIPPIWFMRQAGRYHSHYRSLKEKYTFEQLCKSPELAAEVAYGPIKEFDFDVAILFSDILYVLEGLGLELKFDPGPKFSSYININNMKDYANIDQALDHLKFQSDAIKITRERISNSKSLIGFVGGPWTLVRYAFGKDKFIIDNKIGDNLAPNPLPEMPTDYFLLVKGFGAGHGVGMSQWGAKTMAERGSSFRKILRHYYTGVQIKNY